MLRKIPTETITLGMELPGNVCDNHGTTLLPAGTVITEQHLAGLAPRKFKGIFVDDDWPADQLPEQPKLTEIKSKSGGAKLKLSAAKKPEPAETEQGAAPPQPPAAEKTPELKPPEPEFDGELVPVDKLRIGSFVRQDIYDPAGRLLLAAGHEITARFLFLLRQRGARVVRLHADDLAAATRASHPLRGTPTGTRLSLDDLRAEAARGLERHTHSADELEEMAACLARGRSIPSDKVHGLIEDFSDMVELDPDLVGLVVAAQQTLGEYLFDHCINVAMLSVAALHQIGMDREQIQQVGLGAAFQDVGMLRISESVRMAERPLTAAEWSEVRRHPTYSCDSIERVAGISPLAANISFQVHERADGSGYPRGRLLGSIHPGARIVAIADAYAAMIRPRPHRPAHLPHQAMQTLLREARRNKFDRVALKAFLDMMSVYPVGSLVQLSTGQIAQVVRSNPGLPTRPVVAPLDPHGNQTSTSLDLRFQEQIQIVRGLDPLALRETTT